MILLFLVVVILLIWVGRLQSRVRVLEEHAMATAAQLEALARARGTQRREGATVEREPPSQAQVEPPRRAAPPESVPPVLESWAPPPPPPVESWEAPPLPASLESDAVTESPMPREAAGEEPGPPPAATAASESPEGVEAFPSETTVPPTPPPLPRRREPAIPVTPPPAAPFDWEALVGVKLFSWIAGVALALGAIFFLRYSVQNGWLQPPVRLAIGVIAGISLLVVCEMRAARRYAVTANALDAAGIVILFSTFFAAHALWDLIPATATFALLVLVTAVAVLLSIRRNSVFVALLGLLGGFATPALLASGKDNPLGLFGYLLLLTAGLAWVAYSRRWVILLVLSAAFTTLYQWGWVMTYLSPGKLGIASGIFLVFPLTAAVFLATLGRRPASDAAPEELTVTDLMSGGPGSDRMFEGILAIQATLPLFFALYLAGLPVYAERVGLLFGFLFCVDAGLFAVARWRGPGLLHLTGGATTVGVFLVWAASGVHAWPMILSYVALFVLFYLGTGWASRHGSRPLDSIGGRAVYAAPLLLFMFTALAGSEPRFASPGLPFGVLFALMTAVAVYAIAEEDGIVHFVGSFFALVTAALWSAWYLTPERLMAGLAIDGAFSLFYLGVPILARRWNRVLRPAGLSALLLLASIGLLFFFSMGSMAESGLWGLALLLAILNLAILAEGTATRYPVVATSGTVLSWLVLVSWWMSGALGGEPISAMIVTTGFAVLTLGGQVWLGRQQQPGAKIEPSGMALAFVGHLFLAYVASQVELSLPPWPLFGVLAVLDLAIAVAVLYTGLGEMQVASLAATQVILLVWVVRADSAPWPTVAAFASLACAAFGLAWVAVGRRVIPTKDQALRRLETGAGTAFIMGQVTVWAAGTAGAGSPSLVTLLGVQFALLLGVIVLAGWTSRFRFVLASVVPASLATFAIALNAGLPNWLDRPVFGSSHWLAGLAFATPLYAAYLACPLLFGRRSGKGKSLYLAPILFSVSYFLVGYRALSLSGFRGVIGALPLAQAVLLGGILAHLIKIEPRSERALGRLALVAGSALAFITLAIPVQVEKEWLTIGWALEAAALAWLYTRIPHRGLFWTTLGLVAVVFARLALNPDVLSYAPHHSTPILNWFLYTYLVAAAAFFLGAWLLAQTDDQLAPGLFRGSTVLASVATILLFLLLNIEIADFYTTQGPLTFNFSAGLAQDLTYTLGWAVFAVGLLAAGIVLRSKPPRLAAIVLLTVTVFKGFLYDTSRLGGLYRVFSFVGLALCLALVAVVLQRFVLSGRTEGTGSR